jgi:hypothetical protein
MLKDLLLVRTYCNVYTVAKMTVTGEMGVNELSEKTMMFAYPCTSTYSGESMCIAGIMCESTLEGFSGRTRKFYCVTRNNLLSIIEVASGSSMWMAFKLKFDESQKLNLFLT